MGVTLPKPLMTKVEERDGNNMFRVGSSCVNGYRENMEDAHIVYLKNDWGFFGVFDGHVNENCSAYLEGAFKAALDKITNVPLTDEFLQQMALQIDAEWMAKNVDGGSTGTFFLAHKEGGLVRLQVGNVGDSRVVACIDGECKPMTTDHKPSNDGERARILNCGGRVENDRVDGSLAVSRAFGDRDYKQSPGGALEQKVIALADVTHVDMKLGKADDFVALCCDGVFESNFSNEEVVAFIKEKMASGVSDLAVLAGMVCDEAVARGSRDNISCMIVQFVDGSDMAAKPHLVTVPGPFNAPRSPAFTKMYKEMAVKGGMSIEEALEKRYDNFVCTNHESVDEDEKAFFGQGPPSDLSGEARTAWFLKAFDDATNKPGGARNEQMSRLAALQQQMGIPLPVLLALMGGGAGRDDGFQ